MPESIRVDLTQSRATNPSLVNEKDIQWTVDKEVDPPTAYPVIKVTGTHIPTGATAYTVGAGMSELHLKADVRHKLTILLEAGSA